MAALFAHLRTLLVGLVVGGVVSLGGAIVAMALVWPRHAPTHLPDPPALVERVREVARLETLDVSLYKKVAFEPDPKPAASFAGELTNWATWTVNPPVGKAIVFADAHLGFDVSKIDATSIRVSGDRIEMILPPMTTTVEIRPGETEVVHSNLDSARTALMLDKAKWEMASDVDRDAALRARARASAERSLRALFVGAGFKDVRFVDALSPVSPAS